MGDFIPEGFVTFIFICMIVTLITVPYFIFKFLMFVINNVEIIVK
jgi:hypothetical protein